LDKLVRNSPPPEGEGTRMHAFPALSVPEDRIVADAGNGGSFQRIRFNADGRRRAAHSENDNACESFEDQLRMAEKKAYGEGFTDGKQTGGEEARKEMAATLHQFRRAYVELEKFRKEIYLNAEATAVELALAITRKLVHFEVSANPNVVAAVIRDALTRIVDQERICIHVNPSDMQVVTDAMETFVGGVKSTDSMTFEPDTAVVPGGCMIVTNFGEIDAGIDTQIAMIEERLTAEFDTTRIRR